MSLASPSSTYKCYFEFLFSSLQRTGFSIKFSFIFLRRIDFQAECIQYNLEISAETRKKELPSKQQVYLDRLIFWLI